MRGSVPRVSGLIYVLCPLQIERRVAARAAAGRARIITAGPGAESIAQAVRRLDPRPQDALILFGVAGGLIDTEPAPIISAVIDAQTGARSTPTLTASVDESASCVSVVGVSTPVTTVEEKRALAGRTGAALVDCESHAFAQAATERGLEWAVVRGVSDGPLDTLPPRVARWVDTRGRSRPIRIALDLARDPGSIADVARLGRSTRRALDAAAARLTRLLDADPRTIPPS